MSFTQPKILTLLILTAILILGCTRHVSEDIKYSEGSVEKTSKDFVIPRDLRIQIEKKYVNFIHQNNPKIVLSDEDLLARIPREFLDVNFQFRSSAPNVLNNHVEFSLPRGGGEIDLGKYVVGSKGSFFLKIKAARSAKPKEELDNLLIYFLSNAKQKKYQNEVFGVGCHGYMEVTNLVAKSNKGEGIHLNATDHRYIPVIGGIFYFFNFSSERKIFIASVRVTDSRFPDMYCDDKL